MIEHPGDKSDDTSGRSGFGPLWSETLIETLYDGIHNDWSNNALKMIIKELNKKGYLQKQILDMVETKFGKRGCRKLIKLVLN
jgi:DNA-directed RNA polymerase specialized sigma54-like protein